MEELNISLIQTELAWESPETNRRHFAKKIAAIGKTVDLILLPEMFPTGFSMAPKKLAESPEGESLQWMQKQARAKGAAISGSVIVEDEGQYYNRLYFVFPEGNFETYDKRHLFSFAGEDQSYSAGRKKLIVHYKGWKICPLICYDLRFPVWARNRENYDLLYYIANWPDKRTAQWDALLRARSIENLCYTAGLNRIGADDNHNDYNGHSAVYHPLGKRLSGKNWEDDFVETITLHKKELQAVRKQFPFLNDRDIFQIKKD